MGEDGRRRGGVETIGDGGGVDGDGELGGGEESRSRGDGDGGGGGGGILRRAWDFSLPVRGLRAKLGHEMVPIGAVECIKTP